jgi:hypothetical protein
MDPKVGLDILEKKKYIVLTQVQTVLGIKRMGVKLPLNFT